MRIYRQFPGALRKVIASSYGGNQRDFAEAAGMTAATISRLCAGTREITRDTLEKLAKHLPEAERRRLYLAVIRDFLPDEAEEMFFPQRTETPMVIREDEAEYSTIDQESKQILEWLYRQASNEEEVRVWLRTLGKWINSAPH